MRRKMILPFLAAALSGCATSVILPAPGFSGAANAGGITLYADPEAWDAYPLDLPRYITPVAVRIVNYSGTELRVSYGDFALTDERGYRYATISPFGTGAAPPPPPASRSAPYSLEDEGAGEARAVLVVHRGPVYRAHGPRVLIAPGRRFYVYPRVRHRFYFYQPWSGVLVEPPYYSVWVYRWGGVYPRLPSDDVQRLALPEGVVRPGGEISGFVYFQQARARASRLLLTFHGHAPDGRRLATLQVPFVVAVE